MAQKDADASSLMPEKPDVPICLGATAAQALLGKDFRVTQQHGVLVPSSLAPHVMAAVHPSSILRMPDEESCDAEMKSFVADLKKIAKIIGSFQQRQ